MIAGKIEDTNSPYLVRALTDAGFKAEFGGIIEDSISAAVSALDGAMMRGFGLIITTGGVGAESKDHSIEAVLEARSRRFHAMDTQIYSGHEASSQRWRSHSCRPGRNMQDSFASGPHAEVCLGSRALIEGLEAGLDDAALAESIASVIRDRWLNHMGGGSAHG